MSDLMEIIEEEDQAYCDQLKELLASLKTWDQFQNEVDLEISIEEFMDRLWELYLDYFQFHQEEAKICLLDFQELLISQVPNINKHYVAESMSAIISADDFQDPWEIACKWRSRIEAFHELFGYLTGRLEDDEIVEFVEERKDWTKTGVPMQREKIPKSHWWWFVSYSY